MKNSNTLEANQHGIASRLIEYVKSHNAFDGIKNETWMYLTEHSKSATEYEAKESIVLRDFDNYLH